MLNLAELTAGDRVQHELLVFDRTEKAQTNGDPFVILTLGNATGQLSTAPVWSNQLEWVDGAQKGAVVQALGQIGVYPKTGKRQIQLTGPLRVIPASQIEAEKFLPRIAGDPTRLWQWIDRVRNEVQSATIRSVLDLFFCDDDFRLRFERTPGSTGGHHAKVGGLLLHVYEVTSIARSSAKTMRANLDLVTAGALLHDIGKIEAYSVTPSGFSFTPCGLLVGHIVLGVLMLERKLATLDEPVCTEGQLLELQHLILSHHGKLEFGSPVQPMTLEAEILHWADEVSAKGNDMSESLEDPDAFAEDAELSEGRIWRVGRRLWRRPHSWD